MIRPNQAAIKNRQRRLRLSCEQKIARILLSGQDYFSIIFPVASVVTNPGDPTKKIPANLVLEHKSKQIKKWVGGILDRVIAGYETEEQVSLPTSSMRLTEGIASELIRTIVEIVIIGRDLRDVDYYLIADVARRVGLELRKVYGIIEQVQYQTRKEQFETLKTHLDEEQRDLCSILFLKAIQADNEIHPAEIKYFENISQLLEHDQARLERLEAESGSFKMDRPIYFSDELTDFMFKYLIEIVMCDNQYDPKESRLIREVAKVFNMDKTRQEEILQPVAAALMVKASLFRADG